MKIIYGDDRDDPRDYSIRKRKALLVFEGLLIIPWAITLRFVLMIFGSGGNILLNFRGAPYLIPYIIYPGLVLIFSIASRFYQDRENFKTSYFLQLLPIIIPPATIMLVRSIVMLKEYIA